MVIDWFDAVLIHIRVRMASVVTSVQGHVFVFETVNGFLNWTTNIF